MKALARASATGNQFIAALGIVVMLVSGQLFAADFYASPSGNNANSCTSAAPCKTIQAAIDKAAANDTVHVGQGNYAFSSNRIVIAKAGLKLIGDNSPFDASSVPGAPVKSANASVLQAASDKVSSGTSGMIWVKNVANVEVRNLYIEVDGSGTFDFNCLCTIAHAKEGIVATGAVNNLIFDNNYVKLVAGTGTIGISVNLAAGNDSSVPGSEPRTAGQFVTLSRNVVEPTIANNAAPKRAIAVQNDVGTISGNQVAATTQDMWIQSPVGGGAALTISDNWFYGRLQLYVSGGSNLSSTLIDGNHFDASQVVASGQAGNGSEAHSLRVMGSNGASPTTISNNEFSGFGGTYRALWVMSRPNATIENNTFTPAANQSDFTAIVIGNREVWNGLPAPNPYAVTIRANTFNANGAPAGNKAKAILFVDDNDANGVASFTSAIVGGTQLADANQFDSAIGWYIALDDRSCTAQNHTGGSCNGTAAYAIGAGIAYSGGSDQSSQKRRFQWDVNAAGNTFGGLYMPSMTQAQYDAVWLKTYDHHNASTDTTVGNVDYGYPPVKTVGTVTWGTLSFVYDGTSPTVAATITQDATPCVVTGTVGPNVGDYDVHADCDSANYTASADETAYITAAAASLTLSGLARSYDGSPKSATVSANPVGVTFSVTYDGNAPAPTDAGTYTVVAHITDTNYQGSDASGSLIIAKAGQTITNFVATPTNPTYSIGGTFSVSASGGASGNALVFTSTTQMVCTVSDTTVTMLSAGICKLSANQAGNANYQAALPVGLDVTINAPPQPNLGISISNAREFVQYGKAQTYTFVVRNIGNTDVSAASVDSTLPTTLISASWTCHADSGSACGSASGTGDLHDTGVSIAQAESVMYVVDATVNADPGLVTDQIDMMATVTVNGTPADIDTTNNAATDNTQIVILRDGFESGGDGAQRTTINRRTKLLDRKNTLTLDASQAPKSAAAQAWLQGADANGHVVLRIDTLRSGRLSLMRVAVSDAYGNIVPSAWMSAQTFALGIGGNHGGYQALIATEQNTQQLILPDWVALPLDISAAK